MPKLNTTVKSVRIDNDVWEELNERLDCTFNEWANGVITDFLEGKPLIPNGKNNSESEPEGKPLEADNERLIEPGDYENLRQMGCFLGYTPKEMVHLMADGLENGTVTIRDGKIVGQTELNLDALEEVCHEKGLDLQKAIDKAVLMLWK